MNVQLAAGKDLDAIGTAYGVIRLPREPDADFRNRLVAHIRALRDREWGL